MRTDVTAEYIDGLDADVDHVFFIEPDDSPSLVLIRQRFALTAPLGVLTPTCRKTSSFCCTSRLPAAAIRRITRRGESQTSPPVEGCCSGRYQAFPIPSKTDLR